MEANVAGVNLGIDESSVLAVRACLPWLLGRGRELRLGWRASKIFASMRDREVS